jgi:hypothetical protein
MIYKVEGPTTRFSDKLMRYLSEKRADRGVSDNMYDFILRYLPTLNRGFIEAQYVYTYNNNTMIVKGRMMEADLLIRGIHCERGVGGRGIVECGRLFYDYINGKLMRVGYVEKGRQIYIPDEIWEVGNPELEALYKRKVCEILS